jgi:pSer/pThr/pTyr-binding forkhead associated (FHA) protein
MPIRLRVLAHAVGTAPAVERAVEIADGTSEIRIGRRSDLELPLPFPEVSPVHARIRRAGRELLLEDLGSAGGTWLGAERLVPGVPRPLVPGTELAIAHVALVFEGEGAAGGRAEGTATIARRLVADLFAAAPDGGTPELELLGGPEPGRRLVLRESGRPYLLGRGPECDLAIAVEEISREHAAFVWTAEGVVVRDLGSKNGIMLAGARLEAAHHLRDGDVVGVGPLALRLRDPVDRYLRELEQPPSGAPAAEALPEAAPEPEPEATSASEPASAAAPEPPRPPTRAGRFAMIVALVVLAAVAAAVVALVVATSAG